MAKSMTGYGRAEIVRDGLSYELILRSVNHRFLDLKCSLPQGLERLEPILLQRLRARLSRGHVELSLRGRDGESQLRADLPLASSLFQSLLAIQQHLGLSEMPSLATLTSFPEIFRRRELVLSDDEILSALDRALAALIEMRAEEGRQLAEVISVHAEAISAMLPQIEARAELVQRSRQEKLRQRIQAVLSEGSFREFDGLEARLAVEISSMVERADIAEELARLRSHLSQLTTILASIPPHGKKLDFLLQELAREGNTLGAKSQDAQLSQLVVELKSRIEQIREQIQNIE